MTDGMDPRAYFGQQCSRYPGHLTSVCQMVCIHVEHGCDRRNASLCLLLASARSTGLWLLWCSHNWSAPSLLDQAPCYEQYLGDQGKSSARTMYPFFSPPQLARCWRSMGLWPTFESALTCFMSIFGSGNGASTWYWSALLLKFVDLPGFSVQPVCYWPVLHEYRNIQSRLIEPQLWWVKII